MANPEHLAILNLGVEQWNKWRKEHPDVRPQLSAATPGDKDFRGINLRDADLNLATFDNTDFSDASLGWAQASQANFNRAKFERASLYNASFDGSELTGADLGRAKLAGSTLRGTDLVGSNLSGADLSNAELNGANLRGANLSWAILESANFSDTWLDQTIFAEVDLSRTLGLDTAHHVGPSSVGIDTIYLSRGEIPEKFLRGSGVPEGFIAYIGSMVGRPIEFYSCFISYSTKDQEFADKFYADLQNKGVRCWFAPHDIKGGQKIYEQIDDAIRFHDKLLLILSADSMASEWVRTEIAKARKREINETKRATAEAQAQAPGSSRKLRPKRVLFPITLVPYDPVIKEWECFDADTGKDSAQEIREYFVPDFSNWKDHDSYHKAFQRLVEDLKAEANK